MITFHKIVLAIAGLLNNGISSPAPQGNPALRNRTTALASAFAERQEPTSAKTPPSYRSKSPTLTTNRVISPRRNTAPPSRTAVPTYTPSTNRVTRPPLRRRTPSTNQVSRPIPNRNRVVPSRTIPTPTRRTTPSTNSPAATPKPKPKPTPTNPPGSGIGDSIAGNYIYDALTGQRVAITPPMRGKMTAIPSVNQINGTKRRDTVQGENDTRVPQMNLEENDGKTVAYDANHSWTEYYVIHWTKMSPIRTMTLMTSIPYHSSTATKVPPMKDFTMSATNSSQQDRCVVCTRVP